MPGLFMSMIYPTLNSKGISCFPKTEHGAIAGVILFFTAAAALVTILFRAQVDAKEVSHGQVVELITTGRSGSLGTQGDAR